jgi:hypothetical protein
MRKIVLFLVLTLVFFAPLRATEFNAPSPGVAVSAIANPTSVTFTQTQVQYDITNHYEAAVLRPLDNAVMTSVRSFSKPSDFPSGGNFTLTLPPDFFVGSFPPDAYVIGVRAVSGGGPGPWALSPETKLIAVPLAVTNVQIGG